MLFFAGFVDHMLKHVDILLGTFCVEMPRLSDSGAVLDVHTSLANTVHC